MGKPMTETEAREILSGIDRRLAGKRERLVVADKAAKRTAAVPRHRNLKSVLIYSDAHIPFQDRRALNLVKSIGRETQADHQVTIGDWADVFALSRHKKHPSIKERNFKIEVDAVNAEFDELDAIGGERRFVCGNHCERLTNFLIENAPQLIDMVTLEELFHFKKRGWRFTPYGDFTRVGKLHFTHDVGVSGEGALKRTNALFQASTVTGHTHIMGMQFSGNARGDRQVNASFGWLGDARKVTYVSKAHVRAKWQLGFGYGYMEPNGVVHLQPVPIIDYRCVVGGQLFDARGQAAAA